MSSSDEEFGIQDTRIAVNNIVGGYGIHVMDDHLVVDVVPLNRQITTKITSYDVMAKIAPLSRRIELLIHPTIMSESRTTHGPS